MIVLSGTDDIRSAGPVVTVGSFDGVHRGHRHVIGALCRFARECGGLPTIVTFDPHPRQVLFPDEPPVKILSSFEEKIDLFEKSGVECLMVLPFTRELAAMDYRSFVRDILVERLGVKGVVVGYDHRFGRNREGSFETLKELADEFGFRTERENVFCERDINVSSTKIRDALSVGDLVAARDFLGYDYGCRGEVVCGYSYGRTIGFPTANIRLDDECKLLPADGVYAVTAECCGEVYGGMMNIGVRPTVRESGEYSLEVNIFGLDRDIYGSQLKIKFIARMRDEVRFPSAAELEKQLERDKIAAMGILHERCHFANFNP